MEATASASAALRCEWRIDAPMRRPMDATAPVRSRQLRHCATSANSCARAAATGVFRSLARSKNSSAVRAIPAAEQRMGGSQGTCSAPIGLLRFATPAPTQELRTSSSRADMLPVMRAWAVARAQGRGGTRGKGKCNTPPASQRQAGGTSRTTQHRLLARRAHSDLN